MKKIVVVVLALFLLSNNAWAGEVYQNQTQQSQYCQNIVTQGNKEAQRHPNRPDTMLLWEQGHPGCYNSTTTPGQKQGVLDAIDGIFVQANSALSAIGTAIFLSFAFVAVFMVGVRILFGVENSFIIPAGKVLISLSVVFALLNYFPAVQSQLVSWAQSEGYQESLSINNIIKSTLATTVAGQVFALVPPGGTLDPIGLLKTGAEVGVAGQLVAQIEFQSKIASAPHWYDEIGAAMEAVPNFLTEMVVTFIEMIIFFILAVEALLIIAEGKILFIIAPLAIGFMVFNSARIGVQFDYFNKLLSSTINLAVKVILFYLVVEICLVERAIVLSHNSTNIGGVEKYYQDLGLTILVGAFALFMLHYSGKIFGHAGASFAAAVGGLVGSAAGTAATTAATAGAGLAVKGAAMAGKAGISAGKAAAKTGKEFGKGAFHGAKAGFRKGRGKGDGDDNGPPSNPPPTLFPKGDEDGDDNNGPGSGAGAAIPQKGGGGGGPGPGAGGAEATPKKDNGGGPGPGGAGTEATPKKGGGDNGPGGGGGAGATPRKDNGGGGGPGGGGVPGAVFEKKGGGDPPGGGGAGAEATPKKDK